MKIMTRHRVEAAVLALAIAAGIATVCEGCDCGVTIYVENDAQVTFGDTCIAGAADCGSSPPGDGEDIPDAGVPGGDAAVDPDAGVDDGSTDAGDLDGAAPDADLPDAAQVDAGWPDGGGIDGAVPCAPAEQLWYGLGPMSGAPGLSYSETVTVTFKGISLPGGTCNLLYFDDPGSPAQMQFCYTLPYGYEIPVAEGEVVHLVVVEGAYAEGVAQQKIFIWDQAGDLRFFAYSGDPSFFDPAECADPRACPVPGFLESDCTPADDPCGKVIHPPVGFFMGGGACDVAVQQGEVRAYRSPGPSCPPIARGKLAVARSMKMTENSCDDHPDASLSTLVFNNSKVSQCLCRDHDDCAPGDLCETEVGRCVRAVPPGVPCEAGKVPDPYTGACFLPFDQSNVPCATTADCAARNAGVCNTWWRESFGTGFCKENPCEVMDCAWGCAPLVGACYECLSDCGCYVPEGPNRTCDLSTRRCAP